MTKRPLLALSAVLSALAAPGCTSPSPTGPSPTGHGAVQNSNTCSGIPNCELQQQAPVSYGGWGKTKTRGWAYYCTGDHPYFWGVEYAGMYNRWVQTNSCFETSENPWAQAGDPGKLDVTVTNWCVKTEDYVISLACSSTQPPELDPTCGSKISGAPVFAEPGCPKSNVKTFVRSSGSFPATFQIWEETCSPVNGVTQHYSCSLDEAIGLLQCSPCTTTGS
ncbi:hypothetical protein tb265_46090 [Gemmatimonadetes bacterium T265]|nr:hypothetical protein tb265_46090 [Gemmatimonadetes bacterium T265]